MRAAFAPRLSINTDAPDRETVPSMYPLHGTVLHSATNGIDYTATTDGSGWASKGFAFSEAVGPASGSAPSAGGGIQLKTIDISVTLAANGTANITYGTAFPNGTLAVLVHNGDSAAAPNTTCEADSAHWTVSGFQVYAFTTTSGAARTGSFRVVGVAFGW